jgi:hypothetical protein
MKDKERNIKLEIGIKRDQFYYHPENANKRLIIEIPIKDVLQLLTDLSSTGESYNSLKALYSGTIESFLFAGCMLTLEKGVEEVRMKL